MTSPKPKTTQTIKYSGNEPEYCSPVTGENVVITCTPAKHTHGSSKVKLINRIDYNWEFRYYHGHLVTAHINGKVFAYAMKGKDGGMVRIGNQETNQRALIKNLKEDVKDLSFSFSRQDIILGCVDSEGNVLVYEILDEPSSIQFTLLLHIYHRDSILPRSNVNYKLIWCPYLCNCDDDEAGDDDPEKMFVLLNGSRAEVYNVGIINSKYGVGPFDTDESYSGYIEINHNDDLVDASFSSDGTAIAIASLDGYVKFFQLYMFDPEKQKCLHEWHPHEGKTLSSIIFIDNVLEYSSECWKFTITGANHNSEIKLWSCETWTCLQIITFNVDPPSGIPSLYFNMAIDYTGQYLILSDINNRVLYALKLHRNDAEQMVFVTTFSKFLLPAPFLSFHIMEAKSKNIPFTFSNSSEDLYNEERDDYDDDVENVAECIKMLIIQPKKFQECNIIFQPETLMHCMNDCDIKEDKEKIPQLNDLQSSVTLLIQQQTSKSQTLMTPEDFNANSSRPNSVRNSISSDGQNNKSLDKINDTTDLIDFQKLQKDNFASGGSSPSREVQEILSLNNSSYSSQDFFGLTKMEEEKPQKEYNQQGDGLNFQEDLNTEMVWPKIPVVKDNEIVKNDNNTTDEISEMSKSNLQAINFRISSLENTIREQNIMMQQMHKEMKTITQMALQNNGRSSKGDIDKELELAMSKQQLQFAKMLENLINVQKSREHELQEHIISSMAQMMNKCLLEKVPAVIANEMKPVLIPAVHSLIEQCRKQIDAQYAQRLASTDMMLRESVSSALNTKALADSLSMSVVNIVAPSFEKCYRDIVYSSLVPSWEKVCSSMFQQINETFTRGTKEYTVSVENYMDRQKRFQEKSKDIIVQMQNVSDSLKSNSDKLTNTLTTEIHKQFNYIQKSLQDKLSLTIREAVSEQVKLGFKNHATVIEDSVMNAVRSRAVTPSPHVDTQATLTHIQQHLARGNYDDAFQLALSAENVGYVIYACEKADLNTLFGDECLLQQSCLLALIQQLSMDLHKNTELKLNYIRAAILALSTESPNTKHFIPKVVKDLLKQLNIFIASNPPSKQLKECKLLKMAAESLLV